MTSSETRLEVTARRYLNTVNTDLYCLKALSGQLRKNCSEFTDRPIILYTCIWTYSIYREIIEPNLISKYRPFWSVTTEFHTLFTVQRGTAFMHEKDTHIPWKCGRIWNQNLYVVPPGRVLIFLWKWPFSSTQFLPGFFAVSYPSEICVIFVRICESS